MNRQSLVYTSDEDDGTYESFIEKNYHKAIEDGDIDLRVVGEDLHNMKGEKAIRKFINGFYDSTEWELFIYSVNNITNKGNVHLIYTEILMILYRHVAYKIPAKVLASMDYEQQLSNVDSICYLLTHQAWKFNDILLMNEELPHLLVNTPTLVCDLAKYAYQYNYKFMAKCLNAAVPYQMLIDLNYGVQQRIREDKFIRCMRTFLDKKMIYTGSLFYYWTGVFPIWKKDPVNGKRVYTYKAWNIANDDGTPISQEQKDALTSFYEWFDCGTTDATRHNYEWDNIDLMLNERNKENRPLEIDNFLLLFDKDTLGNIMLYMPITRRIAMDRKWDYYRRLSMMNDNIEFQQKGQPKDEARFARVSTLFVITLATNDIEGKNASELEPEVMKEGIWSERFVTMTLYFALFPYTDGSLHFYESWFYGPFWSVLDMVRLTQSGFPTSNWPKRVVRYLGKKIFERNQTTVPLQNYYSITKSPLHFIASSAILQSYTHLFEPFLNMIAGNLMSKFDRGRKFNWFFYSLDFLKNHRHKHPLPENMWGERPEDNSFDGIVSVILDEDNLNFEVVSMLDADSDIIDLDGKYREDINWVDPVQHTFTNKRGEVFQPLREDANFTRWLDFVMCLNFSFGIYFHYIDIKDNEIEHATLFHTECFSTCTPGFSALYDNNGLDTANIAKFMIMRESLREILLVGKIEYKFRRLPFYYNLKVIYRNHFYRYNITYDAPSDGFVIIGYYRSSLEDAGIDPESVNIKTYNYNKVHDFYRAAVLYTQLNTPVSEYSDNYEYGLIYSPHEKGQEVATVDIYFPKPTNAWMCMWEAFKTTFFHKTIAKFEDSILDDYGRIIMNDDEEAFNVGKKMDMEIVTCRGFIGTREAEMTFDAYEVQQVYVFKNIDENEGEQDLNVEDFVTNPKDNKLWERTVAVTTSDGHVAQNMYRVPLARWMYRYYKYTVTFSLTHDILDLPRPDPTTFPPVCLPALVRRARIAPNLWTEPGKVDPDDFVLDDNFSFEFSFNLKEHYRFLDKESVPESHMTVSTSPAKEFKGMADWVMAQNYKVQNSWENRLAWAEKNRDVNWYPEPTTFDVSVKPLTLEGEKYLIQVIQRKETPMNKPKQKLREEREQLERDIRYLHHKINVLDALRHYPPVILNAEQQEFKNEDIIYRTNYRLWGKPGDPPTLRELLSKRALQKHQQIKEINDVLRERLKKPGELITEIEELFDLFWPAQDEPRYTGNLSLPPPTKKNPYEDSLDDYFKKS